jgi:hypothetical protein
MKLFFTCTLFAGILGLGSVFLAGAGLSRASGEGSTPDGRITIDYPLEGSVFPPEITSPTVLWRDGSPTAKHWVVEVSFAAHAGEIRLEVPGELMQPGELDPQAGPPNELTALTPQQAVTHIWKPDSGTWEKIKRQSVKSPATISITGFADDNAQQPVSSGTVNVSTSIDPVGAPIFYRDVPLMLWPKGQKGSIQPLPPFAIPLIKWKLRNISDPQSRR